jgi:hypothetical protein
VSSDSFDALRRRDEILEVMYWMRGERLGDAVSADDLRVFLGDEVATLEEDLAILAADGLVEPADLDDERYRLTRAGVTEGGRRFADDFADFQRPGHGACDRPGCVCRQFGPEACVAFSRRPA